MLSEALKQFRDQITAELEDAAREGGHEAQELAAEVLEVLADLSAQWAQGSLSGLRYCQGLESLWHAKKSGLARISKRQARLRFANILRAGFSMLGGLAGGLRGLLGMDLR